MNRSEAISASAVAVLLASVGVGIATATEASPQTERVSVDSNGVERSLPSFNPSISGDGRRVAFESFPPGENPSDPDSKTEVYVHDRLTGTTELVSVGAHGEPADAKSFAASISLSGRYVAFNSGASNLAPGGRGGVFVRDLATRTTERISSGGGGPPSISGSGRFVSIGGSVYDRKTGARRSAGHSDAALSADGRFVAYQAPVGDGPPISDVFVTDVKTGTNELVDVTYKGKRVKKGAGLARISAHGRYVAFISDGSQLVRHDSNGVTDVFVRDLRTDTTRRASVDSQGREVAEGAELPSISANGRFVAFISISDKLVKGDTNGAVDVFVHDLRTGRTRRVSINSHRAQGNDQSHGLHGYPHPTTLPPALSAQGEYVAFESLATNLAPNDTNDDLDVFVRGPLPP